VQNVQCKMQILYICRCDEWLQYGISVCSGISLTICKLFTAVAMVSDHAIQCKTFLIT